MFYGLNKIQNKQQQKIWNIKQETPILNVMLSIYMIEVL